MFPLRCPRCFSENITDYVKRIALCRNCNKEFWVTDELFDIIHQLWGKAVISEGYGEKDKLLWSRLQEILHSIVNMLNRK